MGMISAMKCWLPCVIPTQLLAQPAASERETKQALLNWPPSQAQKLLQCKVAKQMQLHHCFAVYNVKIISIIIKTIIIVITIIITIIIYIYS